MPQNREQWKPDTNSLCVKNSAGMEIKMQKETAGRMIVSAVFLYDKLTAQSVALFVSIVIVT